MEIFISWSGTRSEKIAITLREWLPKVVQSLEPWMSASDIDKGARWLTDISEKLSQTNFGIICLTPENKDEPWILFEAGALSKALQASFVCPLLFELEPSSIKGPLSQFQSARLNKEDVLKLLCSINKCLDDKKLTNDQLEETFDLWWPKLEKDLKIIEPVVKEMKSQRTDHDILEEMLSIIRGIDRRLATTDNTESPPFNIDDILRTLTPKEEMVIRMSFGIGTDRNHTLEEIGRHLSLSTARISQIKAKALRSLKHPARSRALKEKIGELRIFGEE